MRFINSASFVSQQRGYDYYKNGMVKSFKFISEDIVQALVKGSGNSIYNVEIDVKHPKKSKCNCPFAEGNTKICKHKIATYFTSFPEAAEEYENEVIRYIEEEENYWDELEYKLDRYIASLTKDELVTTVYELLVSLPDWVYEEFALRHIE